MYLKLKIEGELLEMLQQDAQEQVRSTTQQAMYIIKSYYKNNSYLISREATPVIEIEEQHETVVEKTIEEVEVNELIDDEVYDF